MELTHLLREPIAEPNELISQPGQPTGAAPGSPRKIRILTERAARREPLFHPLDGPNCLPAPEPVQEAPAEQEEIVFELVLPWRDLVGQAARLSGS